MLKRLLLITSIITITFFYTLYTKSSLQSQLASETKFDSVLTSMPSATFETLDGKPYSLDELYKTEPPGLMILHYWGTWCAPCEAELPELLDLVKQLETKPGVKFLLVATNDEVNKVKKHLKTLKNADRANVVWLLDNKNVHRDLFGTIRVPETYVFSSDKATLRKFIGPQEWNKTVFFQTFVELLQISTRKM